MKERIQQRLSEIEREKGVRIVYACESGSRAWGFASEDSDYDVRFLYVWPEHRHLEVWIPPDVFDFGVDEEAIDCTGWDVRKALSLFRKANGSLMEWLFSPIVYREDQKLMDEWKNLVSDFFLPKASAAHYLGLSRKIRSDLEKSGTATAKKYLYVVRALFGARFVVEKSQPVPVLFDHLCGELDIPKEIRELLSEMIQCKAGQNESDKIDRNPILDRYILEEQERLDLLIGGLASEPGDAEVLNRFFRKMVGCGN